MKKKVKKAERKFLNLTIIIHMRLFCFSLFYFLSITFKRMRKENKRNRRSTIGGGKRKKKEIVLLFFFILFLKHHFQEKEKRKREKQNIDNWRRKNKEK